MRTLRYLAVFFGWNLVISGAVLLLPPLAALPVVLLLYGWLLQSYLLRDTPAARRRRSLVRLRPLAGAPLRWTLASAPVLLVMTWALEGVYLRIVPVPPQTLDPLGPLMATPLGALTVTVLAVGVAPVVEEVFFRGLIQRSLERRVGAVPGIAIASALFAAIHLLPWVFPLHLFLGAVFGFVVYTTRSVWAGVILHAGNNAAALAGLGLGDGPPERTPTVWEIGPTPDLWTSVLVLLVATIAAAWVARRLWWAARPAGTF